MPILLSTAYCLPAHCLMITRSYQPSDLPLILELAHRDPAENLHVIDLPYRLSSWALSDPNNARLWFDETGVLRAWSVLQSPFWIIDYALDPASDRSLHGQILDWAVESSRSIRNDPDYGLPAWYVNVLPGQTGRIADLTARGFTDQMNVPEGAWSKVFMARPADLPLERLPLPDGYRLRDLEGQADVATYVELHQEVFESKNMTEAWRSQVIRQPAFRPELNLVIEAPDASLAAFCIGWYDPSGFSGQPCGQIEPLGVRVEHRGLDLAKNLSSECFRRMHALGAGQIYVETDNYRNAAFSLYESLGFQVIHTVHVFGKDF